jgi:Protein of unknown function (DUF3017)
MRIIAGGGGRSQVVDRSFFDSILDRLTDAKAGWLRIRRRRVDLTMLAALGVALLILALVVPARHG